VEIPDCGHLIPLEQPERLTNAIASFIERET
jgi:pimeloyl-ACP methyl ester carboxylesterase